MERANQVLAKAQIYPNLSAHTAVYLGQQRGWNLDEINAAHKGSSAEASQVSDYAAAQGHDSVGTRYAHIHELIVNFLYLGQAFGFLARWNHNGIHRRTQTLDLLFHIAQIQLGNVLIADNHNAAVAAENFIHLKQMLLQAIADHNFVLMLVFSRTG
ncbi:hypothetical protein SDC9_165897 [bioreactor metagenome]|uniref:Uncharacterized protein n=1 Tax=bioreactor metagenome TaxID=1076179 RepID=A0A645FVR4_9ZZZZ